MNDIAAGIRLAFDNRPVSMVPCTITSLSPLRVSINGATNILGVKLAGLTYSTGAALALVTSPGTPVILPIGE
jgi:hypothetical protein